MLANWIGRQAEDHDIVTEGPVRGLIDFIPSADVALEPGDSAPLLSHWLHFLPYTPLSEVGEDGHPRRGGFLPPVSLPRRMWASSDIVFHRQLRIGTAVSRRSTIRKIIEKEGRSGKLVFVHVDREIHSDQGQLVSDRQTIVYRDTPTVDAPAPTAELAPSTSQWRRRIDPDPVMLFRYSALTFNGHRIHYDHPYATGTEGYPGLVVHGPLIATLLLHEMVARHPDVDVASYSFRAVRPIFDTGPFFVCGSLQQDGVARLFASDESGALCMSATATLR